MQRATTEDKTNKNQNEALLLEARLSALVASSESALELSARCVVAFTIKTEKDGSAAVGDVTGKSGCYAAQIRGIEDLFVEEWQASEDISRGEMTQTAVTPKMPDESRGKRDLLMRVRTFILTARITCASTDYTPDELSEMCRILIRDPDGRVVTEYADPELYAQVFEWSDCPESIEEARVGSLEIYADFRTAENNFAQAFDHYERFFCDETCDGAGYGIDWFSGSRSSRREDHQQENRSGRGISCCTHAFRWRCARCDAAVIEIEAGAMPKVIEDPRLSFCGTCQARAERDRRNSDFPRSPGNNAGEDDDSGGFDFDDDDWSIDNFRRQHSSSGGRSKSNAFPKWEKDTPPPQPPPAAGTDWQGDKSGTDESDDFETRGRRQA